MLWDVKGRLLWPEAGGENEPVQAVAGVRGGRWELAGLGHAVEALGSLQVCWVVRLAVGSPPMGALGRGLPAPP